MKFIIGSDKEIDTSKASEIIDTELSDNNKNYKVARTKSLKRLEVDAIPVEKFYSWSEEFKKLGGQAKIPRVMNEDDFKEFKNYVKQVL